MRQLCKYPRHGLLHSHCNASRNSVPSANIFVMSSSRWGEGSRCYPLLRRAQRHLTTIILFCPRFFISNRRSQYYSQSDAAIWGTLEEYTADLLQYQQCQWIGIVNVKEIPFASFSAHKMLRDGDLRSPACQFLLRNRICCGFSSYCEVNIHNESL